MERRRSLSRPEAEGLAPSVLNGMSKVCGFLAAGSKMASGAHVTSANLVGMPTIFEVIAQERLTHLIPAALSRLTDVLVIRYPLLTTFASPMTIVASAHTALQAHFLFMHNATAGEHFYGLERVNSRGDLTPLDKFRSLLIVCVLPLVKQRVEKALNSEDQSTATDRQSRTLARVKKLYPYVATVLQSWDFVLSLRYLMGKSQYHSVEQLLTGSFLRRARPKQESKYGLVRAASSILTYSVTIAVFFVQFVHWWQEQRREVMDNSPIPVPPIYLRDKPGPCRLCGNDVVNAAVLSTSGFVFCYPCIYGYVSREGRCPMTGYPSTLDSLVRLHITGS